MPVQSALCRMLRWLQILVSLFTPGLTDGTLLYQDNWPVDPERGVSRGFQAFHGGLQGVLKGFQRVFRFFFSELLRFYPMV